MNRKTWTKQRIQKIAVDVLFIIVGCSVGAFATISILIPNGLSSGGVTGIARILQGHLPVSYALIYYALSFVILTLCAILLGWREASKIVLLTVTYPLFLLLFERLGVSLLEQKDIILAAIYCGVFTGIGSGLIFTRGYSFGGTDTLAKIIKTKWFPQVGLSKILLVIDAVVIITSGVFFGRNIALYALVTQVIFSRVVEYVMYGFDTKVVQLEIITKRAEVVAEYIMRDINRGVSSVEIVGGYTKIPRQKLITLCSPRESMLIKKFVADADPKAFVTVLRVETVWGKGVGFNDLTETELPA